MTSFPERSVGAALSAAFDITFDPPERFEALFDRGLSSPRAVEIRDGDATLRIAVQSEFRRNGDVLEPDGWLFAPAHSDLASIVRRAFSEGTLDVSKVASPPSPDSAATWFRERLPKLLAARPRWIEEEGYWLEIADAKARDDGAVEFELRHFLLTDGTPTDAHATLRELRLSPRDAHEPVKHEVADVAFEQWRNAAIEMCKWQSLGVEHDMSRFELPEWLGQAAIAWSREGVPLRDEEMMSLGKVTLKVSGERRGEHQKLFSIRLDAYDIEIEIWVGTSTTDSFRVTANDATLVECGYSESQTSSPHRWQKLVRAIEQSLGTEASRVINAKFADDDADADEEEALIVRLPVRAWLRNPLHPNWFMNGIDPRIDPRELIATPLPANVAALFSM